MTRKIWFFWHSGESDMPWLVRKCMNSWLSNNQQWEFILLHNENIKHYLPDLFLLNDKEITVQAYSDIIRINLLHNYGGLWVDATSYCCRPLENWLNSKVINGFFAFKQENSDRIISSWILYADKANLIAELWAKYTNRYWENKNLIAESRSSLRQRVMHFLGVREVLNNKPHLWHSPLMVYVFRCYPYFWFHYLFEYISRTNIDFKKNWNSECRELVNEAHILFRYGIGRTIDDTIKALIDSESSCVFKLTHKVDVASFDENSVVKYLFSRYDH